jgi:hypothetical protein
MKIGWMFLNYKDLLPVDGLTPISTIKNTTEFFKSNSEIPMCPAFGGYFKNTWTITAPVDIEFQCIDGDIKTNSPYIVQRLTTDSDIITIPLFYIFVSDKDVMVESTPAFMYTGDIQTKMRFIPGTFNISKWLRPIDFSAQILSTEVITIKKGDPLFYVRFITEEKVELEQITDSTKKSEIYELVMRCTQYKFKCPRQSLKSLYMVGKEWIGKRKWFS